MWFENGSRYIHCTLHRRDAGRDARALTQAGACGKQVGAKKQGMRGGKISPAGGAHVCQMLTFDPTKNLKKWSLVRYHVQRPFKNLQGGAGWCITHRRRKARRQPHDTPGTWTRASPGLAEPYTQQHPAHPGARPAGPARPANPCRAQSLHRSWRANAEAERKGMSSGDLARQ